jgi:hypothetical protein
MTSTYTVNKSYEMPSNGSYNDDWDQPVNSNFAAQDNAAGGHVTINVTGIASGAYALSLAQYQPPIIIFSGTMSGALAYVLPPGVGGLWSVFNSTNGTFNLTFGVSGGSSVLLPAGQRTYLLCDGVNTALADTASAAATLAAAENYAAAQASAAQTAAIAASETYAAAQASAAQTAAEAFATAADAVVTTNTEAYAAAQATAAQTAAETFSTAALKANYRAGTFNCINGTVTVTFSTPFPVGTTPVVVFSFNYTSYNAGGIPTGTITNAGFQFQNSNAGPCSYYATVAN